jgi:hypothetical protein
MKLEELKPNTEYAQMSGKYRRNNVRFSEEQLTKARAYSWNRNKGQVTGEVWDYWGGQWEWRKKEIPLNQIKMTWAEWQIEAEEQAERQAKAMAQRQIADDKRAQETKALQEFLSVNGKELAEILGQSHLYTYSPRLEVKLSLETLTRLLERMN